jgi:hypothetical protein
MENQTTAGPSVEYFDDEGRLVSTGAEALRAGDALVAETEAHNRRVLRRMSPQGRRAFSTFMRTGLRPKPVMKATGRVREPRGATPDSPARVVPPLEREVGRQRQRRRSIRRAAPRRAAL